MKTEPIFAEVGDFCPNPTCSLFEQLGKSNIIKFGKTRQGRQRYRCKACSMSFCERTGTLFHGKHTDEDTIIEVLMMLIEKMSIAAISRVKGIKEDTILSWVREAGQHAEAVEEALLARYKVSRAELDGLWSFVANKGEKKTIQKPMKAGPSGV